MTSPARRLVIALVLFFFLAPAAALAQNQAKMSGTVADHEGNPVKDAVVRLTPTDDKGTLVEAKSKKKGNYLIGMIRPGPYKLVVEAPDEFVLLKLQGRALDLTGGRRTLWEIDQDVSVDKLPPINVGALNQIELNMVVGPKSMTPEARQTAAIQASLDAYTSGSSKIKSGDYAGGLAELEPLLAKEPENAGLNYLVGFAKNQLGEHQVALSHIDRALASEPALAGGLILRGQILQNLGRNDEAEQEFRKELERTTDPKTKMQTWASLVMLYEKTGRTEQAIETLESAVALEPRRELLLELADLYARTGNREKAAATLEKAESVGGMDDVALLNLAIGYINDKNYDQAERLASRLVEKGSTNPNLAVAHSVLARCDLNRGKLDEGAVHLKKSLELDPNSPLAAENREILAALKR